MTHQCIVWVFKRWLNRKGRKFHAVLYNIINQPSDNLTMAKKSKAQKEKQRQKRRNKKTKLRNEQSEKEIEMFDQFIQDTVETLKELWIYIIENKDEKISIRAKVSNNFNSAYKEAIEAQNKFNDTEPEKGPYKILLIANVCTLKFSDWDDVVSESILSAMKETQES